VTGAVAEVGARVRVVASKSMPSRLHAGRTGTVVAWTRAMVGAVANVPTFRSVFPNAVVFDGDDKPFVWANHELEVLS